MKMYKLVSVDMVNTVRLFQWAEHVYRTSPTDNDRDVAVDILASGYGLGQEIAKGLLNGEIEVEVDEEAETVAFAVEGE